MRLRRKVVEDLRYRNKAMRYLMISISAVVCCGILSGCAVSESVQAKELDINEDHCSLETWGRELPAETEAKEIVPGAIRGLSLEKAEETFFAVSYEPEDYKESFNYWEISVPYHSTVSVDTETLYELFGTVAFLGWQQAEEVSWENSGLYDSTDSIFLAYDNNQREGEKGQPEPSKTMNILFGDEDGAGHIYMGLKGNDQVYLVDKSLVDAIFGLNAYDYTLKIPTLVGIDTVSKVDIQAGKKKHSLNKDKGKWTIDGEGIDEKTAQKYFGKLLDVMIRKELPSEALDSEKGELLLTIQFHRADPKAPDVETKYYAYDEEYARVCVNGNSYFLVSQKDVETLTKAF